MTLAAGSQSYLAYIAELTFGTTPATPELFELRTTGNTISLSKETLASEEIRSDRQMTDVRHGVKSVAGDINVELSDGGYDDMLEAVLGGTWAANVLKAGSTFRSFTFERGFTDISQYLVFKGVVINSMAVNIATNAMVTTTFGVIGKTAAALAAATIDTTGGLTAVGTAEPFDGFTGTINEGGATIATITALEFTLDNGAEPNPVIGSNEALSISLGRSNLTGQVTAHFENETLLNKFVDETISSIDMTLTRGALTLKFDIPEIKYTGGTVDVSGEKTLILTMPFQALRDDAQGSNIVITRSA